MSEQEKVSLAIAPSMWGSKAVPVLRAAPFWHSTRGTRIHRPYSGLIFFDERPPRICLTWVCGNSAQNPVVLQPGCALGLSPCPLCEAKVGRPAKVKILRGGGHQ